MGISFGAVSGAGRWGLGSGALKSFADVGLERVMMQSSSSCGGVTGIAPHLSTRTSLFSTRYAHALQVRDPVFVKRTRRTSYVRTGADSRVGLASAPAMRHSLRSCPIDMESLALTRSLLLLSPTTRHSPRVPRHAS